MSVDRGRDVEIVVGGVVMVRGQLQASVEADSWTWTLGGGKLGLMMTKEAEAAWPGGCLWSSEAGPEATRGIEVTDDTEDTLLANMTTENQIVDNEDNKNAFNSEQLEDVDSYEDTDLVTWLGEGGEVTAEANMTGYQHLCSVMEADSASPSLVTRHDVDGLVWRLSPEAVTHVATFPALGYVQASKTARKFISAPSSCGYSVISDNARHLYVYRQPQVRPRNYHRIFEFLTGYFTGSGGGDGVEEQEIRSEGVQGGEAAGDHLGQPGGDPGHCGPLLCACGVNKGQAVFMSAVIST